MQAIYLMQAMSAEQETAAEEILRVARENDIPLRCDPALAGALTTLDVGRQSPPELFRAVAALLAFVYTINEKA